MAFATTGPMLAPYGVSTREGACNYCTRWTTAEGNTPHHVTTLAPAAGGGVSVRFCDDCLRELARQVRQLTR